MKGQGMDGITIHDVKPMKKRFKIKFCIAFRISCEIFFLK